MCTHKISDKNERLSKHPWKAKKDKLGGVRSRAIVQAQQGLQLPTRTTEAWPVKLPCFVCQWRTWKRKVTVRMAMHGREKSSQAFTVPCWPWALGNEWSKRSFSLADCSLQDSEKPRPNFSQPSQQLGHQHFVPWRGYEKYVTASITIFGWQVRHTNVVCEVSSRHH